MLKFSEWVNLKENFDPKKLLNIYERITNAAGSKGVPSIAFDTNFLRTRAGLDDMDLRIAMDSNLITKSQSGWVVNPEVAKQLGQQFNFNPIVSPWLKNLPPGYGV